MTSTYSHPNGLPNGDINTIGNSQKRFSRKGSVKLLTQNDSKILGNYGKKLAKTSPPKQFKTSAFKTIKSNFTPNFSKTTNEQLYKERRELISNWFESWSDSQRKRFMDVIFKQCRKSQLYFIQQWFGNHVPLRHLDFTRVLPRCLSLYIMSFLDPRSLCRASAVCWHWKFIAEQDSLWTTKCLKQGWFLPYEAEDSEYGAWKRHYVACLYTLDVNILSKDPSGMYGGVGDGTFAQQRRDKKKVLSLKESREVLELRPLWQPPDRVPHDIEWSTKAVAEGYNPNNPVLPKALLLHHNKWGIPRSRLSESTPDFSRALAQSRDPNKTVISDSPKRRYNFPLLTKSVDALDLTVARRPVHALSETLELERFEESRLMELVGQPWEPPPPKLAVTQHPKVGGAGAYPLPWKHQGTQPMSKAYLHEANPRIVFISSRVPAADVLVDAVNFGIIPIVYEYEGTTLEALIVRLDKCLQGRCAKSVGIFAHTQVPGDLRLVHSSTITIDNLDTPEVLDFFQAIASHVLPATEKGHVDIFVPLAATEAGMEMMIQLNLLTGLTFTSPTGIIGNYNHINSEWMRSPEVESPPEHYFCMAKLNVWANTADQVKEACNYTKSIIGRYFDQKHRDVVSQVTGQVVFDAVGQVNITGVDIVTETLVDGLIALGEMQNSSEGKNNVKPLEFLGAYLLERSGRGDLDYLSTIRDQQMAGDTLKMAPTMNANTLTAALNLNEEFIESLQDSTMDDVETELNIHDKDVKELTNMEAYEETLAETLANDEERTPEEDIIQEVVVSDDISTEKPRPLRRNVKTVTMKSSPEFESSYESIMDKNISKIGPLMISGPNSHSTMKQTRRTDVPRQLTAQQFKGHPEKRTPIAQEILASEINYMRTLDAVCTRFYAPIRAALSSNRAILSAPNAQIIFNDVLAMTDISRELVEDLKCRMSDWSPSACLGDIMVRFCTKLKVHVNFLNNYPLVLSTLERAMEYTPVFRAFLKRHERRPETKMMTLPELLLAPTRRIGEYVTLLAWFKTYTPLEHPDRPDLDSAIRKLSSLNQLIMENKERGEKERELLALQNKIVRCPLLTEANRYFLRQLDVAHLNPPSEQNILPEFRVYQHIEMLGLFLFNDSLVVTRRTTRNFPFERATELIYRFETCAALNRLRLEDIPDSKYVKNAFRMYTPRRTWICSGDTADDKTNWVSLLENTIRACLATK